MLAPVLLNLVCLVGSSTDVVRLPAREAQYWLVTRDADGRSVEKRLAPKAGEVAFEAPADVEWRLALRDSRGRLTDADLKRVVQALAARPAPGLEIISPTIPSPE